MKTHCGQGLRVRGLWGLASAFICIGRTFIFGIDSFEIHKQRNGFTTQTLCAQTSVLIVSRVQHNCCVSFKVAITVFKNKRVCAHRITLQNKKYAIQSVLAVAFIC